MKPLVAVPNLVVALLLFSRAVCPAADPQITVQTDQPGIFVPPTLHGLFFEDINYAADGGLYAELIQNRSFEHRDPMYAWKETVRGKAKGRLAVENEAPLNANNQNFLRIYLSEPGEGFGAENSGFDGIALRQDEKYLFSVYIRRRAGETATLKIQLEDSPGHILAEEKISGITRDWTKHDWSFKSSTTVSNAQLVLLSMEKGALDVDMVSLFPEHTFKNRRNGLRADLAQALADAHPGFLRFPGGCIVEGKDFENMYRWKNTIGDIAERKENWDLWQDRTSPQYSQTYGLGFFEYFQFCEDIGAEPLPVVNCGMCCQARQGPPVPLDKIEPYVQDALDLIEFANGPVTSEWGAKRAALGHPKPFNLKFLAVGNEQWQQVYFDRYDIFYRALKAKYPDIKLVSTSGPFVNDPLWNFAWNKFRTGTPTDMVDEHYYVPPRWLLENVDRYATYDRKGPKVFVGEFAGQEGNRHNDLRSALSEAAYMTGLWRNADVVSMASYAPLFAKVGHVQWRPDLIWFDNTRLFLTPNYYVQQIFSRNRPDIVLPTAVESAMDEQLPKGMVGVGTWNTQAEFKDIRVTAPDGRVLYQSDFTKGIDGWKTSGGDWQAADGVLRQGADGENIRAVVGDPTWTDYTLTLHARKLGGSEGFLVMFHMPDIEAISWWNLGGWHDTEHSLQGGGVAEDHVRGTIEVGRWYDIRIELGGNSIKAYLDEKLIHEADLKPVAKVYAVAGRDVRAKELVLQMVNPGSETQTPRIKLNGLKATSVTAQVITLANANPEAENTLDNPAVVTPQTGQLNGVTPDFSYTLPPYSLTTLRIPEK